MVKFKEFCEINNKASDNIRMIPKFREPFLRGAQDHLEVTFIVPLLL